MSSLCDRSPTRGRSRKPGAAIRDLAEQYAEAIGHEFSEPVRVEGVSTGGSIAQQFAIDHARLVHRLVLVATACRLAPYGREVQRRLAVRTAAGSPRDAASELHRIEAPTLVIGGARDRFYSPELFRETAERIPDSRLCLYPRKGHVGTVTSKQAIRDIIGFLLENEAPA